MHFGGYQGIGFRTERPAKEFFGATIAIIGGCVEMAYASLIRSPDHFERQYFLRRVWRRLSEEPATEA